MPSKIKSTIYKVVLAANILAIIMLLLVGNVDSLHPVDHPWLANCVGNQSDIFGIVDCNST